MMRKIKCIHSFTRSKLVSYRFWFGRDIGLIMAVYIGLYIAYINAFWLTDRLIHFIARFWLVLCKRANPKIRRRAYIVNKENETTDFCNSFQHATSRQHGKLVVCNFLSLRKTLSVVLCLFIGARTILRRRLSRLTVINGRPIQLKRGILFLTKKMTTAKLIWQEASTMSVCPHIAVQRLTEGSDYPNLPFRVVGAYRGPMSYESRTKGHQAGFSLCVT